MSNFNDKIKALLAFSSSFEGFKSDIEAKLDKLNKPVDLSGLVKKDDLNQSIDSLSEELKKAKFDAFAFESARRTFGEEIGVLKSFVDKEVAKLNDSIESSNSSDEIKELIPKQIESLKLSTDKQIKKLTDALSEQSKQMQELKRLLSAKDSSDKAIKSLIESVASINKRVESMSSDNTVSTLKSELAVANKQIVKLQNDFTNFKSAFEE